MNDIENVIRRSVQSGAVVQPLAPWAEIERRAGSASRPLSLRRGLALGGVAVVLVGALLFGGSSGSGPSPLERASAAVADWPPNQILHLRILTSYNFPQADSLQESWQLTSPPYTMRSVSAFPAGATGGQRSEFTTDSAGAGQQFDWRTGEVAETTNLPVEWRQSGLTPTMHDQMAAWIERSHARSLGTSEVDGHTVVGFEADDWGQRIYVDSQTYLPILAQSFGCGVGDQRRGYDEHYFWELLPATPDNRGLLDVSRQHPSATPVAMSQSAWRAVAGQLGGAVSPPVTPCA